MARTIRTDNEHKILAMRRALRYRHWHEGIEILSQKGQGFSQVPITPAMRAIILATPDLVASATRDGAEHEPSRPFMSTDGARMWIDRIMVEQTIREIFA